MFYTGRGAPLPRGAKPSKVQPRPHAQVLLLMQVLPVMQVLQLHASSNPAPLSLTQPSR